MKGLLYTYTLLNKTYFIVAGAFFVVATVAAAIVFGPCYDPGLAPALNIMTMMIALAGPMLLMEPVTRDLEKNMKSRFLNYALTGITRREFMLTQLVINVGSCLIGAAMMLLHYFIINLVRPDIYSLKHLGVMALFIILGGVMEWILIPLTIKFKSSEKAGALFGFVIGFGVIMPIMCIFFNKEENGEMIVDPLSFITPELMLIALGVTVAAYIIGWFIISNRVRKGDLC